MSDQASMSSIPQSSKDMEEKLNKLELEIKKSNSELPGHIQSLHNINIEYNKKFESIKSALEQQLSEA